MGKSLIKKSRESITLKINVLFEKANGCWCASALGLYDYGDSKADATRKLIERIRYENESELGEYPAAD